MHLKIVTSTLISLLFLLPEVRGINPPDVFQIPSPSVGYYAFFGALSNGTPSTIQFQVDTVATFNSGQSYIVTSDSIPPFITSVFVESRLLRFNKNYYYRGRICTKNDTSSWSNIFQFTTTGFNLKLETPANNTVGDIQLLQSNVVGSQNSQIIYQFQLDTNSTFSSPLARRLTSNSNKLEDSTFFKFGLKFYWRARTYSILGDTSGWSSTWTFTTRKFVDSSISSITANPFQVINWPMIGSSLERTEIQMSSSPAFNPPLLYHKLTSKGASRDTLPFLNFQSTYYVRYRGRYQNDSTGWSNLKLTVNTGLINQPLNESVINAISNINLSWLILEGTTVRAKVFIDTANAAHLLDTIIPINRPESFMQMQSISLKDTLLFNQAYKFTIQYYSPVDTSLIITHRFRTYNGEVVVNRPLDNATNQPLKLGFSFRSEPWATGYLLEVDTGNSISQSRFYKRSTSFDTLISLPSFHELTDTIVLGYGKNYTWRVYTLKGQDTLGPVTRRFKTDSTPSLFTPENQSIGTGTIVSGLVSSVKGSDNIIWELDTTPNFNSLLLSSGIAAAIPSNSLDYVAVEFPSLRFETTYFWRVRNFNQLDTSPWSASFRFTTTRRMQLILPSNGSTVTSTENKLDFRIDGNPFSHRYQYQIATDSNFANHPIMTLPEMANSEAIFIGDWLTRYYWRARAFNEVDTSDWSEIRFFTISNPPQVGAVSLQLPLPFDNTIRPGQVTFKWDSAPFSAKSELQVSADNNFNNLIFNDSTVNTEIALNGFQAKTTYYWRVRGTSIYNKGPWASRVFTVLPPTAIEETQSQILSIKPNPVSNQLLIESELPVEIEIYNAIGILTWQSITNTNSYVIDVSKWPRGIYYLTSKDGLLVKKLIVQ